MTQSEITTQEIMEFLQEHMATKGDVVAIIDGRIEEAESRILTSVDRFVRLHETLDQELVMLRSKYNRLEERIEIVEHQLGIATS